jgi:chromosome segregation ATPase
MSPAYQARYASLLAEKNAAVQRASRLMAVSTGAEALGDETRRLVALAEAAESALAAALQQRTVVVAEREELLAACEGLAGQLRAAEAEQTTLQQALTESTEQYTALQVLVDEQQSRIETLEFDFDQANIEACEVPMLKAQLAEARAAVAAAQAGNSQHADAMMAELEDVRASMQETQQALQTEVGRCQALEQTLAEVTTAHAALQAEQQQWAGQAREAAEQRLVSDEVELGWSGCGVAGTDG